MYPFLGKVRFDRFGQFFGRAGGGSARFHRFGSAKILGGGGVGRFDRFGGGISRSRDNTRTPFGASPEVGSLLVLLYVTGFWLTDPIRLTECGAESSVEVGL